MQYDVTCKIKGSGNVHFAVEADDIKHAYSVAEASMNGEDIHEDFRLAKDTEFEIDTVIANLPDYEPEMEFEDAGYEGRTL